MSTVGCYSLDVYCDGGGCRRDDQFTGRTFSESKRDAHSRGWRIYNEAAPEDSIAGGYRALCPDCRKARRRTPEKKNV